MIDCVCLFPLLSGVAIPGLAGNRVRGCSGVGEVGFCDAERTFSQLIHLHPGPQVCPFCFQLMYTAVFYTIFFAFATGSVAHRIYCNLGVVFCLHWLVVVGPTTTEFILTTTQPIFTTTQPTFTTSNRVKGAK